MDKIEAEWRRYVSWLRAETNAIFDRFAAVELDETQLITALKNHREEVAASAYLFRVRPYLQTLDKLLAKYKELIDAENEAKKQGD
jgi:hypothetical protein